MTNTRNSFRLIPLLLAALLSLAPAAFAQVTTELSTHFIAKGEEARMSVIIDGVEPGPMATPIVPGVKIYTHRQGMIRSRLNPREAAFAYDFLVSSDTVGRHVIPPITVTTGGQRVQGPAIEFWVFDPSELKLYEAETPSGQIVRYFAAFHTAKSKVYEGEAVPAEIKIYVPQQYGRAVVDWGVPEFERDGVTSWRFEPADRRDINDAMILGQPFFSLSYPSVLAPTRIGKVGIGPATVRLTAEVFTNEFGGFQQRGHQETFLKIPKLEFESLPLPPGAPEGFENAIGNFTLTATIAKTEITEGESLAASLAVTGSGNLDALHPPKLSSTDGWKIYNPISVPRGDERREISGTAMFHQGLLPLEMKSIVPPFRLVYFDPEESIYKTALSEPIQLIMMPSTKAPAADSGPPPALTTPIERMTDILAVVTPSKLTADSGLRFPWWTGHAIGALAALVLIARALWMRIAPRLKKDPVREARNAELRKLNSIPSGDDVGFLKAAGAFVERWYGANPDEKLRELLAERDRICFRSDKTAQGLAKGRRDEFMKALRRVALASVIFFGCGFAAQADAAETPNLTAQAQEAYDSAKYEEAIRLWQSAGDYKDLSADVLYNIGNASYRLGSPGHAALYYRRALVKDGSHAEARQNLRFIERKYGSISVTYSNYQYALAKIPLNWWKGTFWAGLWAVAISLLIFPATRHGAGIRAAAAVMLVFGPLCTSAGALGWYYYPNDSIFAPVERQAVFIAPKTALHTDAARTSPEVIDAPEGSLCEIRRVSGKWAYVSFATKTRGWVPLTSIEKIIPDKAPGIPKVIRPTADDSNA